MASYTRLGSYLLSSELTTDPLGKVYRGLSLTGSAFDRHHLIRTFTDEVIEAGFGAKIAEAQRVAGLLAGARGFGANYHIEAGRTPQVVCDYIPGRTLAQVLKKTRDEQIPLGVDHSLSVIQGLAQSLMAMGAKDVHHGALSPHSIWVSFEGATHIIDAPYGNILAGLLPKARGLEVALSPYRSPSLPAGLQQDLFALGAVLYEMLTLEKLPPRDSIPAALAKATLKAAQEDGPIPEEIAALLKRLLVNAQSFANVGEFNKELERVLYDGDYSPTTFNMAFFMHTLFREESDQDTQSMKADQGADYTPFLLSDNSSRSILVNADGTSRVKLFVSVGAVVVALFSFMGYNLYSSSKAREDLQNKIAQLQRDKADLDNQMNDIAKKEADNKALQEKLSVKAEKGTAEERAKAKKDLEEAKAASEALAKEKEAAMKKSAELANTRNAILQNAKDTVKPPAPTPTPVQPPPAPVQPPPAAPVAAKKDNPPVVPQPQPQPVAPPVAAVPQPAVINQDLPDTPVTLSSRVNPAPVRVANKAFLPANLRDVDIKVTLKVFVDVQGKPVKVVILQGVSGPFGYNDSAQSAALASGYTPATRNGKPKADWLTLEYNFGRVK